jgi:DNA-directed RNA polymerase beta subunit
MNKQNQISNSVLIRSHFKEKGFVDFDLESFNTFVDAELQEIIDENKEVEPTIVPPNVEEFKIRLDRIWVEKPQIIEADGSKRKIYPVEARLRNITYAAPIYLEVSSHINGIQRESFQIQIGNLPIMLRSKYCNLHGLSREKLIENGEDPDDPGGYFIINGSEKTIIKVEDLAANRLLITEESLGVSKYVGKVFSEAGSYKIPHTIEKLKDGIIYLSFTRVKRVPLVAIIKALGMLKDEEIMKSIDLGEDPSVFINLFECVDLKTREDSLDYIAKKIGISQSKEIRIERTKDILDKYLLPNIGTADEDSLSKAENLCKMMKKFVLVSSGKLPVDDKDHYMNKRLKLSSDSLADLVRVNIKVLIGDLLYNFQRIVKRGKFPSIRVIIREKLLTQRIQSAMATGNWIGGRKGVSQRIERLNFLQMVSHLQRVVSPLSASQENFAARALHCTHLGRICTSETPEGSNIGLRKNMALLCSVSQGADKEEVLTKLKEFGLEESKTLTN